MSSNSIFVSYSRKDLDFALDLTKKLQELGANIWIDQFGIQIGENWDNSIEDALEGALTLLLIISKTSSTSQNVQDEVSLAMNSEKKIVPILIEECELPMRWQRMQYADFRVEPEKTMVKLLQALNIDISEQEPSSEVKTILSSFKNEHKHEVNQNPDPVNDNKEDLLISEAEMDRAIIMHNKAIKKNWYLIGFVGFGSIALFAALFFFFKDTSLWYMTIIAGIMISLLAIKPYGSINKRVRNIELLDLLKLKRDRLTRILNKLSEKEINEFNHEFNDCIAL